MKITCDQCQKQYQIADEKVGEHGVKIKCKNCGNTIVVKPQNGDIDSDLFNEVSTVEAPAEEGEGSEQAAATGEWYASLTTGEQVGPIPLSQIETYWDAMELNEDSLCWKAGMGDWLALAEIPELAHLAIHKPHPKQKEEEMAAPAAENSYGPAPAAVGDTFGAAGAEVDWKPAGASDLSALVKEEMAATKKAEEEAKKAAEAAATPVAPAGLAGLFGNEPTNGGAGNYGAAPAGADPFAAPANDPFAQKPQSAQSYNNYAPAPAAKSNTGLIVVIVLLLVVIAGGALVATGVVKIGGEAQPQVAVAPAAPATPAPVAAPAAAPAPTAPAAPTAAPEQAAQPAAPVAEAAPAAAPAAPAAQADHKKEKQNTKPAAQPKKENKQAKAEAKSAPAASAAPKCDKQKLEGADIQSVVKANLPAAVKGCYPAAKQRGDIPGPVTAEFSFTIEKSGKVSAPAVGPASLANTGFAECVKNAMRKWRFPSFCEGDAKRVPPIKMGLK